MTTEYIGFFNDNAYRAVDGNIVYAKDLNNPMAAIEGGMTSVANAIQTGVGVISGTNGGSVNAYTVNLTASLTAYSDGQMIWLKPVATNTGQSTVDVDSLGAVPIRTMTKSSLTGGELASGFWYLLKYSSTLGVFLVVSSSDLSAMWADYGVGGGITGSIEVSGSVTATARYLHVMTALTQITLPTAAQGVPVAFVNLSGNPNCTIAPPSGGKINGLEENLVADVLGVSFMMIYSGATGGWVVV